ncbi:PPOX class F420-dependent oxidoreductase [Streptomyces griseocarneus]|uniref:PPOX class F420-dependent oxidoreductase n=1 Tax=Streptomyces griseocarneus TaxID=51201 RepID=UPI00167D2B57|nr:PPOX class F420-dependent oxidoreductase [Streptomyces griseocarneus]MBZ6474904.1 PPOX class F420-dependent oxidoreductase [Streptomyces griseocarneus]
MARKMSKEEWREFLSADGRTGKLATVRPDGSPHIAPIWFVLDGDDLVFNTGKKTVKGRNLAQDGRIALCVDDDKPPYAFVTVQGRAHLDDDLSEIRKWATTIGGRYMGKERAEEYGARNGVPGELVVRVRVEKVVAVSAVAD